MDQELKEAISLFELKVPFTEDEIRKKYREFAKKYHSDITHNTDTDTQMAKINSLYDTLKKYLKDPERIAYEAKKEAEKARRQWEEEQRQKEAARKRAEEERLRQEEERRRKEAAERIQKEKFETRIQRYHEYDLFNAFCISEKDYRNNPELRKELDAFYKFVKKCMNNLSSHIERYKASHRLESINELSSNFRQINDYKKRVHEDFKDIKTGVLNTSIYYAEYFPYGNIIGKISLNDLEDYIFMDDKEKASFRNSVLSKLKEYADLQSKFLSPLERIEMEEIDPSKRFKDYSEEIELQKEIEAFVKENYIFKESITTRHDCSIYAAKLLSSFKRFNQDNRTPYNFRLFISNIFNIARRIRDTIPSQNIELNFKSVSNMSSDYDKLIKLYKLTKNKNFNTLYAYYLNIRYYEDNNYKTIYELFDLINERLGNIELIRTVYFDITPIEVFQMTEKEYNECLAYALKLKRDEQKKGRN